MKTYMQTVDQAVLVGFHNHFGGGSMYNGAFEFVSAATFIYGVTRDQFLADFETQVLAAKDEMATNNWNMDQTIAHLEGIVA